MMCWWGFNTVLLFQQISFESKIFYSQAMYFSVLHVLVYISSQSRYLFYLNQNKSGFKTIVLGIIGICMRYALKYLTLLSRLKPC